MFSPVTNIRAVEVSLRMRLLKWYRTRFVPPSTAGGGAFVSLPQDIVDQARHGRDLLRPAAGAR